MTDLNVKAVNGIMAVSIERFYIHEGDSKKSVTFNGYRSRDVYLDTENTVPFHISRSMESTTAAIELLPLNGYAGKQIELDATIRFWAKGRCNCGIGGGDVEQCTGAYCSNIVNAVIKNHLYGRDEGTCYKIPNSTLIIESDFLFCQILAFEMRERRAPVTYSIGYMLQELKSKNLNIMSQGFNEQKFLDFEFEVGNTVIKSSKHILASYSDVFAAMFEADMTESESNSIKITDFSSQTVGDMLRYLHSAGSIFPANGIAELARIADKYNISTLMEQCALQNCDCINTENFIRLLIFAFQYNREKLKLEVLNFAKCDANRGIFYNSKEYLNLITTDPMLTAKISEALRSD